jgi:hypothetical protein
MPSAPNKLAVVQAVMAAHPEINRLAEGERGQITTLVVQALGGLPWGRKAKNKEHTLLSDDALCYRLNSGAFEIYDIISGGDGGATWGFAGTFNEGENGYFHEVEAAPIEKKGGGEEKQPEVTTLDLAPVVEQLKLIDASIKAASAAEIAKLDELKVAIIKTAKEIVTALPGLLGGGGLLGGLLGKK